MVIKQINIFSKLLTFFNEGVMLRILFLLSLHNQMLIWDYCKFYINLEFCKIKKKSLVSLYN